MKLWNFSKIAFLLAFSILIFTGCKKDDDDEETQTTCTGIYSEGTDAATGRVAMRVAATTSGIACEGNSYTWTKDKVWILDGFVFVNEGQTLTIEAGTIIKGRSGQGENASALIVARGGKIIAEGTAQAPIIFTGEADNLNGNLGIENQKWGGVIVLGKARLNSSPGESAIEGIPTSEPRGIYGGTQDDDNSGVLRYVSIRHGGSDIGAGNEINGLTMGGVGSGTTIEYVEVFANKDDGFEWFGGTVNAKYLISGACGDDALDYDEGYRGKNQFVLVYQRTDAGDRGGEHDGGTDPETAQPYATPKFYNVTSVGKGDSRAITFRDNAGGEYHNSIFLNYGKGVDIEILAGSENSYSRFQAGELKLTHNSFINVGNGTGLFTIATVEGKEPETSIVDAAKADVAAYFAANNNEAITTGITRTNLVPTSTASTVAPSDSFFQNTSYRGAFAPGQTPWYTGWTAVATFINQ